MTTSSRLRHSVTTWWRRRRTRTDRFVNVRDSRDPVTPEQRLERTRDEAIRKTWFP